MVEIVEYSPVYGEGVARLYEVMGRSFHISLVSTSVLIVSVLKYY